MATTKAAAASNDLYISYLKTFIIYLLSTVCFIMQFHHSIIIVVVAIAVTIEYYNYYYITFFFCLHQVCENLSGSPILFVQIPKSIHPNFLSLI